MAKKRMFSLSVVDTDLFLEMPVTSRLLYYELGMRADDDGFVDNWKKIMRMASLTEDDMKVLIAKKFILPFESGVIVIRHWRLNNYLRNDRHIPTIYQNEYKALHIENDIYELENTEKSTMLPAGIPMVYTDKNSIDKNSIDKNSIKINRFVKPTLEEIKEYCEERNNDVDYQNFYDFYEAKGWMVGKNKMKDWKASVRTWERNRKKESTNSATAQDYFDYAEELRRQGM